MRKKWVSPAAAVLCAVCAFSSCSGHIPKAVPNKPQIKKDIISYTDWYGEDGSRLRLFSDGFGMLDGKSLRWEKLEETIQCSFFPETTIGEKVELTGVFSEGPPVLEYEAGRFRLVKKQKTAEESAADEEKSEPTPEELIAQEGQEAANLCFGFIGYNYKYGGKTPETGFDCSGLVYYVHEQLGYRLERVANAQSKQGILIDKEDMQPGDVLCFGAPDYCGHVGVYVGQGYYIHAMGAEFGVVLSSLDDPYLKRPKYEVRRMVGCEWLKTENIEAALAAGLPVPTPPAEVQE